jgi:hypothetical protein
MNILRIRYHMNKSFSVFIHQSSAKGRVIAQAVNRRPLVEEGRFVPRSVHVGCGGRSGTGRCFAPSSLVSPVNIIAP